MNNLYYYTTDDQTKKTYHVYTTSVLEPTDETSTLVKSFRYTIKAAADVYEKVICFTKSHMMQTGGCYLITAWEAAVTVDVSTDEGMLMLGAMPSDIYEPLEAQAEEATVTLPLSAEDMMLAGAMESELHMPLEVQKTEVPQEVPQETEAARAKRRIKESATLRQALALAKDISMEERNVISDHIRKHNWNSNLATLSDEEAQRWIDFIQTMRYQDALTRETVIREVDLSRALLAYTKPVKPQIVTTATKKPTAKKIGKEVHVTSGDCVVSLVEKQTDIPVQPPTKEEKKIAQVKPAKEVKKPVEKSIPDSLVTAEQEAACISWPAGEYPGMSIPAGFRVRKEKTSGLYRVDHWTGTAWETYINKAGKIGYTRFASELKQWFEKWQAALGIAA